MAALPIVNGLETEWSGRVQFLHVDYRSDLGKELGVRFGVDHIPAILLIDAAGRVAWRMCGIFPSRLEVSSRLAEILARG